MRQLGEILISEGVLTEQQLVDAIDQQRMRGQTLGRTLIELGMLSEPQLVRALATQVGMEFVELTTFPIDRNAVSMVPETVCRRHTALPIAVQDGILKVAMSNPANVVAVDDIRHHKVARGAGSCCPRGCASGNRQVLQARCRT